MNLYTTPPHSPERTVVILYRDALVFTIFLLQMAPLIVWVLFSNPTTGFSFINNPNIADNSEYVTMVTDSSGSILVQLMTILFFANSILIVRLSNVPLRTCILALLPALLLVLWAITSVAWSQFPVLTLRRASRLAVEVITITCFGLAFQTRESVIPLLFRLFCVVTFGDLAILALPSAAHVYFSGVHIYKNDAGLFYFFALPVLTMGVVDRSISKSRLLAVFVLIIGVGMFILTLAKTAMISVPLSVLLTILTRAGMSRDPYNRIVMPLMWILFAAVLCMVVLYFGVDDTLRLVFGDATITGRDKIWAYALSYFERSPFQGTGYGALWQTGPEIEQLLRAFNAGFVANQGHNGYIDVLAQLGIIGLLLLFTYLIVTFVRIVRSIVIFERWKLFGLGSYALYIFWGGLMINLTDSTYFRAGIYFWFMHIFIATCATKALLTRRFRVTRKSPIGTAG